MDISLINVIIQLIGAGRTMFCESDLNVWDRVARKTVTDTLTTLSQLCQRRAQAARIPRLITSRNENIEYAEDLLEYDLPFGWEVRVDEKGDKYYVDHITCTTTWDKPEVIPDGWEERFTEDYRRYYVDRNTGTTSWELPRRDCGSLVPYY